MPTATGIGNGQRDARAALVRAVLWRGLFGLGAVNGGTMAVALFLLVFSAPDPDPDTGRTFAEMAVVLPAAAVVGALVATPYVAVRNWRRYLALTRWVVEGSKPAAEERSGFLGLAARSAALTLPCWVIGAVPLVLADLRYHGLGAQTARIAVGATVFGAAAWLASLLVSERIGRPLLRLALADEPEGAPTMLGIRTRLLAASGLGLTVPLASLALASARIDIPAPAWIILFAGGVISLLLIELTADAVSGPLTAIRGQLRRVQQGDLDVHLDIEDGGEIGQLQASFNQMVAGLRERRQLEDLFGRHVGADVAHLAVAEGVHLGGETREVSTLFVDIVASVPWILAEGPERAVALLNRFFDTVMEAVTAEHGWINKFVGDAALCVFGAPLPLEDHAARAVRAARSLSWTLEQLRRHHPSLDAGIGVATGTVVAGNVGSEARYEYTVIGDPVNVAARLAELAKRRPSRVLVTAEAVQHADGATEPDGWTHVGAVVLRGREEPTEAYELVAAQAP